LYRVKNASQIKFLSLTCNPVFAKYAWVAADVYIHTAGPEIDEILEAPATARVVWGVAKTTTLAGLPGDAMGRTVGETEGVAEAGTGFMAGCNSAQPPLKTSTARVKAAANGKILFFMEKGQSAQFLCQMSQTVDNKGSSTSE
jgi:hypothetical protein